MIRKRRWLELTDFGYAKRLKRRILIVDDEEVNREILGNILGGSYETDFAEDGGRAYEMLCDRTVRYSLILLDLLMPVMDGFELLQKIKADENLMNIPIIVMTSEKPAEVRSIKLGADDFITKPYDIPEVIRARCDRIIRLYEDRSIIRSAEKDDLTGLYTREFFNEYIRQVDSLDEEEMFDALAFNIEHFHMLNEMYGRTTGDEVLKKVADSLVSIFGDGICIGCRPGADYFYLYVDHRDSYDGLFSDLEKELEGLSQIPSVRIRTGIFQNVDRSMPIDDRFDHAKLACDRIRGDYTKQISLYSKELNDSDLYHERLIHDIEKAITDKDLIVFYQPKYGIQNDEPELRSAEALISLRH